MGKLRGAEASTVQGGDCAVESKVDASKEGRGEGDSLPTTILSAVCTRLTSASRMSVDIPATPIAPHGCWVFRSVPGTRNTVLVPYAHAHRFVDPSVDLRQEEIGTVQTRNWPNYADTACLSYSEGSPLGLGRPFAPEKRFSLNRKETGENQCWECNTASVPFKCQKCGVAWSRGKGSLDRRFWTTA